MSRPELWRTPGSYAHRMMLAQTVKCPWCYTEVGRNCRRPGGDETLHQAREKATEHLSDVERIAAIEAMLAGQAAARQSATPTEN